MTQAILFEANRFPVFQNKMFADAESARHCAMGDIQLVQDSETGLIFNACFDVRLLQYDADYQNEQAHSSVFKQHLDQIICILNQHVDCHSLIEVGCGKGGFLEYLRQAGFQVRGIDPAYEGDKPYILKQYFTSELGLQAEGIILRHVLEHIAQPYRFLQNIRAANGGGGKIYIEVPCLEWICQHRAWFDVFYEHVNYFRLSDFSRLFGKIYDSGHLFGGQYLYVVADLASLRPPKFDQAFTFPNDFLTDLTNIQQSCKDKCNVVWGGASKGVIFSLYLQRAGVNIDYVVDINPAKQGRYLAATGLRVFSPAEVLSQLADNSNIFIMNSNYSQEIIALSNHRFHYIEVDK